MDLTKYDETVFTPEVFRPEDAAEYWMSEATALRDTGVDRTPEPGQYLAVLDWVTHNGVRYARNSQIRFVSGAADPSFEDEDFVGGAGFILRQRDDAAWVARQNG